MSGRVRVWGAPLSPPASFPLPESPARGDILGRRCCSLRGGHGLSLGLKGSEEKVPGTRGWERALLPYAVLGPSPESCQIPNPPGPGGVLEQETTLACLKPPETPSFFGSGISGLESSHGRKPLSTSELPERAELHQVHPSCGCHEGCAVHCLQKPVEPLAGERS